MDMEAFFKLFSSFTFRNQNNPENTLTEVLYKAELCSGVASISAAAQWDWAQ